MGEGSSGSFVVLEQLPGGDLFHPLRAGGMQSITREWGQGGPRRSSRHSPGVVGREEWYSQWAGWEMGTGLCSTLVRRHGVAHGCYLKHGNYFILNITMLFRLCPLLSPGTVCEEEMPRLGVGEAAAPSCVCRPA